MGEPTKINVALRVAVAASLRTNQNIADQVGIKNVRFSKIIHGHVAPTPQEKERIAFALSKTENELFGTADRPPEPAAPDAVEVHS